MQFVRTDTNGNFVASLDSGFASISGGIQTPPTHFSVQSAATLTGVTVYAVSATTGQIVTYDVTEPDGSFSMENLPPDTYTLLGDKEGYSSAASSSFVVSQSNFSAANALLSLTPDVPLSVTGPHSGAPGVYRLEQNYPNPFNPTTNFQFSILNSQLTILKVYDVLGREVATLMNEVKQPGEYSVTWDATKMPSGVYFYRLTAGAYTDTKKLLLLK